MSSARAGVMMILSEHKDVHKYATLGFGYLHGLNVYQVSENNTFCPIQTAVIAYSLKFKPAFRFWGL